MRQFGKLLLATALLALGAITPAQADFGFEEFESGFLNQDGSSAVEAGSHPFAQVTSFAVKTVPYPRPSLEVLPDGDIKDLTVSLPPGFVGDPTAIPACSTVQFTEENCPDSSRVGTAEVDGLDTESHFVLPLYSIDPPPGQVLRMGFHLIHVPVTIEFRVNPDPPFNVIASVKYTSNQVPIYGSKLTIPGVPPGSAKPFLTLPRACTGPLEIGYAANSWQNPGIFVRGKSAPVTITNCDQLDFDPTIEADPTSDQAESPSGIDVDLDVSSPGLTEVGGKADSDIKKTVVTLPEGMTTNSAIASNLQACSLAQFEEEGPIDSDPATGCPEASKVGSVDVTTPLLSEALEGSVYVAKQGDNPFGSLLGLYVVIKNPELGVSIRLAGRVDPDPSTGRLTTTFDEMPQFPIGHLHFHFQSGGRAPLITPATCGTYEIATDLYPYSNPDAPLRRTTTFEISQAAPGQGGCPTSKAGLPHSPGFSAGTLSPKAGAYSPFVFKLDRPDGSQQLASVSTVLPKGLVAKLAGVPACPEAGIAQAESRSGEGQGALEVAQPSCPASSRIGKISAGTGAGGSPYYVSGSAYLAGPYKGAPLSIEIVTPAIAGPFDLGVVAVRTPLYINPETGIVKAVSDPLPSILHGLPLTVRSISLEMDRPNFTLNPTSCEPSAVTGTATSTLGASSPLQAYFQASECGALGFAPKLALKLKGGIKRDSNPRLIADLTLPKSGAYSNIAFAQVKLPRVAFLDQSHIRTVCTRVQFAADSCPPGSIYGKASATSPIVDYTLSGPVYLRSSSNPLPDLVVKLKGPATQPVEVVLVGRTDSFKGGLRNTFEAAPDVPASSLHLELFGGKRGLVVLSRNLCKGTYRSLVKFTAQNNLRHNATPKVGTSCKGKKKKG